MWFVVPSVIAILLQSSQVIPISTNCSIELQNYTVNSDAVRTLQKICKTGNNIHFEVSINDDNKECSRPITQQDCNPKCTSCPRSSQCLPYTANRMCNRSNPDKTIDFSANKTIFNFTNVTLSRTTVVKFHVCKCDSYVTVDKYPISSWCLTEVDRKCYKLFTDDYGGTQLFVSITCNTRNPRPTTVNCFNETTDNTTNAGLTVPSLTVQQATNTEPITHMSTPSGPPTKTTTQNKSSTTPKSKATPYSDPARKPVPVATKNNISVPNIVIPIAIVLSALIIPLVVICVQIRCCQNKKNKSEAEQQQKQNKADSETKTN